MAKSKTKATTTETTERESFTHTIEANTEYTYRCCGTVIAVTTGPHETRFENCPACGTKWTISRTAASE